MVADLTADYEQEMDAWRTTRLQQLKAPSGYLSLVGLGWLKMGLNRIGSAADNDCHFPSSMPAYIGTIEASDDGFLLTVAADVAVTHKGEPVHEIRLRADADAGGPTILDMGTVNWFVIRRGDAIGIRIRDTQSATLVNFDDVTRFALDPSWCVDAKFMPHDEPKAVPIPTILGTPTDMMSPGVVRFEREGSEVELLALNSAEANRFFLIIADTTSGSESYGGGRFLITEPMADDGTLQIDFNKATNPPCAFTPYATCPRPPEQNRMAFPIRAGEAAHHY